MCVCVCVCVRVRPCFSVKAPRMFLAPKQNMHTYSWLYGEWSVHTERWPPNVCACTCASSPEQAISSIVVLFVCT